MLVTFFNQPYHDKQNNVSKNIKGISAPIQLLKRISSPNPSSHLHESYLLVHNKARFIKKFILITRQYK